MSRRGERRRRRARRRRGRRGDLQAPAATRPEKWDPGLSPWFGLAFALVIVLWSAFAVWKAIYDPTPENRNRRIESFVYLIPVMIPTMSLLAAESVRFLRAGEPVPMLRLTRMAGGGWTGRCYGALLLACLAAVLLDPLGI